MQEVLKMTKADVKKQWIKRIAEFDSVNESRKEFCEKRKLSIKAFGYWYVRYGKHTKSSKKVTSQELQTKKSSKINQSNLSTEKPRNSMEWVEVNIETTVERASTKPSMKIKIGKAEIIVEEGFDNSLFSNVAKLLGELC
jgi:hypothetical protein